MFPSLCVSQPNPARPLEDTRLACSSSSAAGEYALRSPQKPDNALSVSRSAVPRVSACVISCVCAYVSPSCALRVCACAGERKDESQHPVICVTNSSLLQQLLSAVRISVEQTASVQSARKTATSSLSHTHSCSLSHARREMIRKQQGRTEGCLHNGRCSAKSRCIEFGSWQ